MRTWQSDAGLPDNTVLGLGQSPDGFLWVASHGVLVRFDGVQFRPGTPVIMDGVSSASIRSFLFDRRGRLWILDDRGKVACVQPGQTVATALAGVPGHVFPPLLEAPDGALWFACEGKVVLRYQDGLTRKFSAADGLPGGSMCRLAFDQKGQLWFAQGGWVGIFREERFCPLYKASVTRIVGARAGGIWAFSGKELLKCDEGLPPVKIGDLPTSLRSVSPTVLYEDRNGTVWIGTSEAGLFSYNGMGFASVATSQQTILCVYEDREGILWVGTRGGGLNQLRPRTVELLTVTDVDVPFEGVTSITQDTNGLLWAVVWQKGTILRSTGQGWTPLPVSENEIKAWTLVADPRGGIWIGLQYKGLCRWENGAVTARFTTANGLAGKFVHALLTTPSGALWIGTEAVGDRMALQCLEQGQFRTFPLPDGSGNVVAMAIDTTGDCWAATSKGRLMRVHQNTLTDETATVFPRDCAISCLFVTPDNSLWIGLTGQGLGRLKNGRFSQFSTEQGLPDDYISNILSDHHDRLWFAGNRGIFSVHAKAFDDIETGKAMRVWPMVYGRNEGLQRLQASQDAWPGALRCADGRLMFAMQSGVAVVYPDEVKEDAAPPLAVIERVTVNGKTVMSYEMGGSTLRLAPGPRQVEFSFTASSLLMPESVGFKYRLQGLDKGWVNAGMRRTADYSQLVPGHYWFQVAACNSRGAWNEGAAALELVVEPYWWETAWFRVAGPLAAAGLLLVGILLWLRRRHRLQIERFEALQATERERARIARDLHDDLGSTLTQIAYLGDSLLRRPGLPPDLVGDIDKMRDTALDATRALDETVWAVDPVRDTLDSLAGYLAGLAQQLLSDAQVSCRLDIPDTLPAVTVSSDVRHHLFLVTKEALHNIIRHAHATEVDIRFAVQLPECLLVIADNGSGFDPDAIRARPGGGHGLVNIRKRIEAIGGQCEFRRRPGGGTEIKLKWRLSA